MTYFWTLKLILMKKIHIVVLVMVVVAVAMLIISSQELSSFATFSQAEASTSRVKIAGTLSKLDPIVYEPEKDPNYFSFYLTDDNSDTRHVIIRQAKPRDFERSESIVVTGKWAGQHFEASEMLLKCPSKYKNEELALRNQVTVSSNKD